MLTLNVNNKYECAICHRPYGDVRGLSTHVGKHHKMDAKAYYDQYVKLADEGKCKVCGAPTKFHTIADGYRETCSRTCGSILLKNDPEKMAAKKAKTVATCMERYGVTNAGPGDEGKTEHEITLERGLFRIYDCGQYRYVWKRGE